MFAVAAAAVVASSVGALYRISTLYKHFTHSSFLVACPFNIRRSCHCDTKIVSIKSENVHFELYDRFNMNEVRERAQSVI